MPFVKPPYYGAAYYPEDWPLEEIDRDIERMLEAGMNVMRIGEFAWSRMEPSEGVYDFGWLHLAVDKLAKAGIATVLGTPSCTPPLWLYERYPECIVMLEDGKRLQHGGRRHGCPNSPVYRAHCARITAKMADEFGKDERVIAWQIDNELYISGSNRGCCCPVCEQAFRDAMRARFGTIEALNAAWGMDLWSQTFDSFGSLRAPLSNCWHHPSLLTAWMDFQSDSYVAFAEEQADILHERCVQPVGTDMMPFGGINYYKIHKKLDLVQYNHYDDAAGLWKQLFWMDYMRPIKPRPFWVTETQTCWNGATSASNYKPRGFCTANSWLPLALGGEANMYWLWRTHWSGQELMHGSVVTSAGRHRHILGEVQEIARGYKAASDFLDATPVRKAEVALHFSCWAWWLYAFQPQSPGFVYLDQLQSAVYRPMAQAQLRCDVIDPSISLVGYKVILSPFLPCLDEGDLRERLHAWLMDGGVWIAGPLTDNRDMNGAKYQASPFGSLEEWTGVYAKYEFPGGGDEFALEWMEGVQIKGSIWYDAFEARDAETLAVFGDGEAAGLAAAVRAKIGKGQIILLGSMPPPQIFQRLLLDVCRSVGVSPVAEASPNVLLVPREDKGLVVVEYEGQTGNLLLPRPARDLLSGRDLEGELDVPPYGVHVLVYKNDPITRRLQSDSEGFR